MTWLNGCKPRNTIYPLVVSWFVDGRLAMRDGAAWLDGERLPEQGHAAD